MKPTKTRYKFHNWTLVLILFIALFSCKNEGLEHSTSFVEMSPSRTGISFENKLTFDRKFNIYTYRNFYNGGGVAIGDINGDTLADIYFTANMGKNKLYLNKGDWKFEDVTEQANVGGEKGWSTGVTMADINSDGFLDIYVCNSGDVNGDNKSNELFINDGSGRFTEQAAQYGLDDKGYSTHAVFFDYDKDGDLDCYLLNNSYQAIGSFNLRDNKRLVRDKEGGDKLYRNDGKTFTDVSEAAGIYGSVIGFGLGITVGDINDDNWPDIYISNDFFERDYIYINNQDGTFREDLEQRVASISAASMGADLADINNDGNPDIFVTEMLPGKDDRLKTKTTFDDWDRYNYNLQNGYFHQYNRNMLQMGNDDHTFTENGRHMGVHATDWSWGALIADFDNDGWKDLFIANGIYQDLTDQDFLNFIADGDVMKEMIKDSIVNYEKLISSIPSHKIENYMYQNIGGEKFENVASTWGLSTPSHSNGAAYGDLDNDGDLDLIVNNVNMPCFVYQNNNPQNNWIQISLRGEGKNTFAINSKIEVETTKGKQYLEFMPQKGFQSSMDYMLHVGLADDEVRRLKITWPDGRISMIDTPSINSRHFISQDAAISASVETEKENKKLLKDITENIGITYRHLENKYVDFDKERLLYLMRSTPGPAVSINDFNKDGLQDIFIGGAAGQANELWIQSRSGSFSPLRSLVFEEDKGSEVLDIVAIDADMDGDLDILCHHGGAEFPRESTLIIDRLYQNDGKGRYTRSNIQLPNMVFQSSKAGAIGDINNDGVAELFVGEGHKPSAYGVPGNGMLIGKVGSEYTKLDQAIDLSQVGLINDATFADLNGDGFDDLVVVGDYMPISIFYGSDKGLRPMDTTYVTSHLFGWWNTVHTVDIDRDGDIDIVAGNHGTNSRFKADDSHPVCMHINDFDQNGTVEQIICTYQGEKSIPIALRHDLVKQLPSLKKKYLKYESYIDQTMDDIFTEDQRKQMLTLQANELRSMIFINNGGGFTPKPLPTSAQLTPIYSIHSLDINDDGHQDLIMGGNLYKVKPEIGRYDASRGVVLLGNGDGSFTEVDNDDSGFDVKGEIRFIGDIVVNGVPSIFVARNDDVPLFFQKNN